MPKPQYYKDFKVIFFKILKRDVQKVSGIILGDNKTYDKLATAINKKLGDSTISGRTLRQWWQNDIENTEQDAPAPFSGTLTLITRYINGTDWDTYYEIESNRICYFDLYTCIVEDLKEGDERDIGWYPFHYYRLRYLGNSRFLVLEKSNNVDLLVGEEKEIYGFGVQYRISSTDTPQLNSKGKIETVGINYGFPPYPEIVFCPKPIDEISADIFNPESASVNINNLLFKKRRELYEIQTEIDKLKKELNKMQNE
jgi:hypothetical protein